VVDGIALEPAQRELEQRVRRVLSVSPKLLVSADSETTRIGGNGCTLNSCLDERLQRKPVQLRQHSHVVTHHRLTLNGGQPVKAGLAANAVHDVSRQFVDPPVHRRDRDTVLAHDVLQRHFVAQGKLHRNAATPFTTHNESDDFRHRVQRQRTRSAANALDA